jgi:hypothetical protein
LVYKVCWSLGSDCFRSMVDCKELLIRFFLEFIESCFWLTGVFRHLHSSLHTIALGGRSGYGLAFACVLHSHLEFCVSMQCIIYNTVIGYSVVWK